MSHALPLIDDIKPTQNAHFDVHDERLQYLSIGKLDEEYLRRRRAGDKSQRHLTGQRINLPAAAGSVSRTYTRIPPQILLAQPSYGGDVGMPNMELVDSLSRFAGIISHTPALILLKIHRANRAVRRRLRHTYKFIYAALSAAAIGVATWLENVSQLLAPKHFNAYKKQLPEWKLLLERFRIAIPAALVFLLLSAAILTGFWTTTQPTKPAQGTKASTNSGATTAKVTPSSPTSHGTKSSGPQASPSTPGTTATNTTGHQYTHPTASTPTYATSTAPTSPSSSSGYSSAPTTGGRGGGYVAPTTGTSAPVSTAPSSGSTSQASTPTTSSSSTPVTSTPTPTSSSGSAGSSGGGSLLPSASVGVPGVNVGVGGTPLVSTSGTNLSL